MFFCSVCFKKTHGEEEFKRRTMLQAEKKEHESGAASSTETLLTATPGCSSSSSGQYAPCISMAGTVSTQSVNASTAGHSRNGAACALAGSLTRLKAVGVGSCCWQSTSAFEPQSVLPWPRVASKNLSLHRQTVYSLFRPYSNHSACFQIRSRLLTISLKVLRMVRRPSGHKNIRW